LARALDWWVSRLLAMSLPEIADRSWRLARHPIHRLRFRTGTYGAPSRPVSDALARWRGPQHFYFDPELAAGSVEPSLLDDAEAVCAGRRTVLGLGRLALPEAPWHLEPRAGGIWPRVDGRRVLGAAPDGFDARLTWELNRGHEWVVLARAHAATGEARYRDRLLVELDSWVRENPVGMGINWASAMEAAIRIHSFAWVAGLLRREQHPGMWRDLGDTLHRHLVFVKDNGSRYSSANNHLIVELSGIAVGARVLGCAGRLAKWHRDALDELDAEVERQVLHDGVDVEMATHYHMFVLEALLLVAALERAHGNPRLGMERRISRMADYLGAITCEDGTVLQQGDNDDGKIVPLLAAGHARQLLQAAASLASGGRVVAPAGEGVRLLCGGMTREPPAAVGSRFFPAGGQVVLCDERLRACLDAGPFGFGTLAAHAHCDALSLAVALDGSRFLVDRGTFRYNGDRAARDRYRMTAAHNTLQLGGREQARPIGPFLWGRRPRVSIGLCKLARDRDVVSAAHDGFLPAVHERALIRCASVLLVIDQVIGPRASEAITARWHFAPEIHVSPVPVTSGRLFQTTRAASDRPTGWLWVGAGQGHAVRLSHTSHSDTYGAETTGVTVTCDLPPGTPPWLLATIGPSRPDGQHAAIAAAAAHATAEAMLPADAVHLLAEWIGLR
jgi:uncharacterized heparinase superfamily protein